MTQTAYVYRIALDGSPKAFVVDVVARTDEEALALARSLSPKAGELLRFERVTSVDAISKGVIEDAAARRAEVAS